MTALRSVREPVAPSREAAGSVVSARLEPALALVRAWAGDGLEAIILSGSHATGDAVWVSNPDGRVVSLSDLDVWVVLRDDAAARVASERATADRARARQALQAVGFQAPLETGFVTRAGLARMPAKPGTLELRRSGRVVHGPADVLDAVPDWGAADVSAEERTLLIENRAFELLLAWPLLTAVDPVARGLARHGVLKAAVDLATVEALACGELPSGRSARIAWALAHSPATSRAPSRFGSTVANRAGLWEAALAFADSPAALDPADARSEWACCARAWADAWWLHVAGMPADGDIWSAVTRVAARAPWRRRIRQSLELRGGGTRAPGRLELLRGAMTGTPRHRVNGSGTALVLAAAETGEVPGLPSGALRALRRLGVARLSVSPDWESARRAVAVAWDHWLHDGARTAAS